MARNRLRKFYNLVVPKLRELEASGCQIIVVACNTITTTLIDRLRSVINVPLIGVEPMIEASVKRTKTGKIAVCATPATLTSRRYADLKDQYAQTIEVIEPNCSDWAYLIEHNQMSEGIIRKRLEPILESGADVIVLGCTHYHWIEDTIQSIADTRAVVVQPEEYTINLLRKELARLL